MRGFSEPVSHAPSAAENGSSKSTFSIPYARRSIRPQTLMLRVLREVSHGAAEVNRTMQRYQLHGDVEELRDGAYRAAVVASLSFGCFPAVDGGAAGPVRLAEGASSPPPWWPASRWRSASATCCASTPASCRGPRAGAATVLVLTAGMTVRYGGSLAVWYSLMVILSTSLMGARWRSWSPRGAAGHRADSSGLRIPPPESSCRPCCSSSSSRWLLAQFATHQVGAAVGLGTAIRRC